MIFWLILIKSKGDIFCISKIPFGCRFNTIDYSRIYFFLLFFVLFHAFMGQKSVFTKLPIT